MTQENLFGKKQTSRSNRGKQFEGELDALHEFYRLQGWIDVVKNAESWVYCGIDEYNRKASIDKGSVATTAAGRCIKRQSSDVDFSGGNGEFSVIFDAKESAKNYISLEMLKSHQILRLHRSSRCGTRAGFFIKFTEANRVFFAPIAFVREKEEIWLKQTGKRAAPGTASISIAELEKNGLEIPLNRKNMTWDWFPILLKTLR